MKGSMIPTVLIAAIVAGLPLSAQARTPAVDPYVAALNDVWAASRSNDRAMFARRVAAGATLRVERTDTRFTPDALAGYAARCRFTGPATFNHPQPGHPHFGKPFTAWAATGIGCAGAADGQYALTIWFDTNGKISSGHLLTAVPMPG